MTLLIATSAQADGPFRATISPTVEILRVAADAPGSPVRPGLANTKGFAGSIRFSRPLAEADVSELEKLGVAFFSDPGGRPVRIGTIYPARISWDALGTLASSPMVRQVDSDALYPVLTPLNETLPQAGATALWGHLYSLVDEEPGEGVKIALIDAGIDVFHPAFFRADGGYFDWLDVDEDGKLTFGVDACDLDRDGSPSQGEILSFFPGMSGAAAPAPEQFVADLDWIFADANGNGVRDAGPAAGFTDADPGFGEPLFLLDDVNRNGIADPREKLIALNSSKIGTAFVKGKEYVAGENLSALDPSIFSVGGAVSGPAHGTGSAGIVVGNTPHLSRFAGMAPGAELYPIDFLADWDSLNFSYMLKFNWARSKGVDVLLVQTGSWGDNFMDGSSNMARALDELHLQDGILAVAPAGNLAGAGKHMLHSFPPGAEILGVDLPETWPGGGSTFNTGNLGLSLYWYGGQGDLEVTLTMPGSDPVKLPESSDGTIQLGGNVVMTVATSTSDTGLVFKHCLAWHGSNMPLPAGSWDFEINNKTGNSVEVHGFLNDWISGWKRSVTFDQWEEDESTLCHPGVADYALTVGAYNGNPSSAGSLRPFSGRGPRIDGTLGIELAGPDDPYVPKPGWSTFFDGQETYAAGGYGIFTGTSASTPHGAGAAVLLKQLNPDATAQDLLDALVSGAAGEPSMGTLPNVSWGWGKLNVYAAATGGPPLPNEAPAAKAALTERQGLTVFLDGADSTDPEGEALRYRWDFDYDGEFDTPWGDAPLTQTTFDGPGQITSKLRVMDERGAFAEALLSYEVLDDWVAPPEVTVEPAPPDSTADVSTVDAAGETTWEIVAVDTASLVETEPPPPPGKKGGGCAFSRGTDAPAASGFCCFLLLFFGFKLLQSRKRAVKLESLSVRTTRFPKRE